MESMTIQDFHKFEVDVDPYAVGDFPHLRHLHLSMPSIESSHWVVLLLNNFPKFQSFKFEGFFFWS